MTHEQTICLIIGIGIVFIAVLFVISAVIDAKKNKSMREQIFQQEEKRLNAEGQIFTAHAEVVDMICGVNSVGHKQPQTVKYFVIKLKTDDGELLNVPVNEEYYAAFEVGLSGTLTLIDGRLDTFVLDNE